MGIKLMVEVLDHYHGPDHKFRWLMAFAGRASDKTRTGWPGRELMARRTGKTPGRVTHLAAELIADGTLRREGGGGRHRGKAKYMLLPLTSQGATRQHPEKQAQGATRRHPDDDLRVLSGNAQGATRQHPDDAPYSSSFNPHRTLTPPGGAETAPTAQTILTGFIDWDRANGGTLTRRTIGQLAKAITTLLAEVIDDRCIRQGLADWRAKEMHPNTLDSFVNAAMNGRAATHPRRMSTGDRALIEAEELKAQLRGSG